MKTALLALLVLSLIPAIPARADFIDCAGGSVYEGDSQAALAMKCGMPITVLKMQPVWVTEVQGSHQVGQTQTQAAGKWETMEMHVYPFRGERVHYVKVKNNRIVSIDTGDWGNPPK